MLLEITRSVIKFPELILTKTHLKILLYSHQFITIIYEYIESYETNCPNSAKLQLGIKSFKLAIE